MRVYYPLISNLYGTSPSWDNSPDNSPADRSPADRSYSYQEFTIASCLTVYHRAEQPRVELDLEITAGSYNAKVNLSGVLQLNFN